MTIPKTDGATDVSLPSPSPWLALDEVEGEDGIIGNQEGFALLQQSIDQLLAGSSDSLRITRDQVNLTQLKISESTPSPASNTPFRERLIVFALVSLFFILIPLLALFGLYRLLHILFS
ncbi:hypothetical protein OKA04_13175 [Luteolibacter flavescens]|uniref:Uncharacterized protein n=1 Tax=Luteolibacter flavescens TaxID=1859460 RepID=A0ABT3FRT3_9BACT|nr:hypothetical protein [Luteolibacter flavescens]MCW1885685.1 hypothetical protein [Luteolibacter flavescens]